LQDPSELPSISEPLFKTFHATILLFLVMNQEDLQKGPPAVGVVLSVATKLGSHCEWRTLDDVRMFQGAWLAVSEAYVRSEEDLGREQPVARGSAREHSAELEGVHLDAWPA
jgi:hypothetical protein